MTKRATCIRLFGTSNPSPFSVHLLLTTRCNLSCPGCFYRSGVSTEWSRDEALRLVSEAAEMGVRWLALGGGEPTLWTHLDVLIREARSVGLKVALTTNGTLLWNGTMPDRVHVSYDHMHTTSRATIIRALRHYQRAGAETGINTIAKDETFVRDLPWQEADSVVLLLEKPYNGHDVSWVKKYDVLVGACLGRVLGIRPHCMQGRTSMALDAQGMAGMCSNLPKVVRYTGSTLQDVWSKIRAQTWERCKSMERIKK